MPAKYRPHPPVAATMIIAVIAHWALWQFDGKDLADFLVPWFDHIRAAGIVGAFAAPFGDYSPAYLYLLAASTSAAAWLDVVTIIKLVSVAGTVALVFAVRHLLVASGAAQPARGAALILVLPTALVNAVLLGQCDAIWAAACVMALAAAVRHHHRAMLAWCGVALAFKLQAVLFAPFVVALLIRRRVPLRQWPLAMLVWVSSLLPAWLAGWPALDLATIYLRQTGNYSALALNAPNIWTIAGSLPGLWALSLGGLALTAALGVIAAYIAWFSSRALNARALLETACLAPMVAAGLLPHMHERYFFLADVLSLAIALIARDRRAWTIAALVQTGSAMALLAYASGIAGFAAFGAVAMIVATFRIARPLLATAANDNPPFVRPSLPPPLLRQG